MLVKELIAELQEQDPEHQVLVGLRWDHSNERWASICEIGEVVTPESDDTAVVITREL